MIRSTVQPGTQTPDSRPPANGSTVLTLSIPFAGHSLSSQTMRTFYILPITSMVQSNDEAERPASHNDDATPPAQSPSGGKSQPHFKLRDGNITVTVFAKTKGKDVHLFIVPERSYRDSSNEWQKTHILHEEDLLRLSLLLMKTYAHLRHDNQQFEST